MKTKTYQRRNYTLKEKRTAALVAASAIATIIDGRPAKLTEGMRLALLDIVSSLKKQSEGAKEPIDVLEILTGQPQGQIPAENVIDLSEYFPDSGDERADPVTEGLIQRLRDFEDSR